MMTLDTMIKLGGLKRQIEIAKSHAQELTDQLEELVEAYEHLIIDVIERER